MTAPVSTYREYVPPAALAGHVLCLWSQTIGTGTGCHVQRVLPDGCADLVWIGDAPPVVAGPATRPVLVPLPPRTVVVGVRFRPGSAPALLGPPASEIADRDTPLGDICRDAFTAPLAGRPSVPARLALAEAALGRRLDDARPHDRAVVAAVAWLARHPGGRIEDLARTLGVSSRQLGRRFAAAVGYGPKTLQRVFRLQRALDLAARREVRSLADLAAAAGYADQAHMSRELRALTGRPPSALLAGARSTLAMSDFFKTGAGPAA